MSSLKGVKESMRLDKFICETTNLSRKEAKNAIKKGKVTIDAVVVTDEAKRVDSSCDVCLAGESLLFSKYEYYMLNKPSGILSATTDKKERTVIDLIDSVKKDLFPVGRLDKDTEGLLFITNDGELAHRLLSPKYHVEKKYYVEFEGKLDTNAKAEFMNGMDIGEKKCLKPAKLEILSENSAFITISEGKYHQVKRMVKKVGANVTFLKRVSFGEIVLDDKLETGKYRELLKEEIEWLRKISTQ